jgi:ankyrin repeat protein
MKKSIIYFSVVLLIFSNIATASASVFSVSKFGLVTKYLNATPLAAAIAKGDIEAVKKFIEYGADVNEKSNGMTPLMIAARYNQVAIIKLLLEKGADAKTVNDNGLTALKYAKMSNAQEAADALTVVNNA